MKNKKLVAQLVDFYWELDETITTIEMSATEGSLLIGGDELIRLHNLRISLDTMLTNVSKRWAKGLRDPKPVQEDTDNL